MDSPDLTIERELARFASTPIVPNDQFSDQRDFSDRDFFEMLDLEYPPLAAVKACVERNHVPASKAAIVAHFRNRTEPKMTEYRTDPHWSDWGSITVLDRADALCENRSYRRDGRIVDAGGGPEDLGGINWEKAFTDAHEHPRMGAMATLAHAWSLAQSSEKKAAYAESLERWYRSRMAFSPFVLADGFHREEFKAFGGRGNEQQTVSYQFFNCGHIINSELFRAPGGLSDDFAFFLLKMYALRAFNYTRLIGSTWRADNHHLMERGVTLYYLGMQFPEFKRAAEMKEYGRLTIIRHFDYNVLPDDVGSEHCSCYNHRCLIRYAIPVSVARANGRSLLGPAREERMRNWLRYCAWICVPDGRLVETGDGNGTTLALIAEQTGSMLADPVIKGIADAMGVSGPVNPNYRAAWDQVEPSLPAETSKIYPHAGHLVMRDGWTKNSMFLHMAAQRDSLYNIHAHWNIYAFTFAANGKRLIGNPTSRTYGRPKGTTRGFYFSMDAHNTLLIDDDNLKSHRALANTWGLQPSRVSSARTCLNADGVFDYASYAHAGYDPLIHRRDVFMVRGRYVLMTDVITMDFSNVNQVFDAAGDIRPHDYRQRIHFEENVRANAGAQESSVIARDVESDAGVLIVPEPFEELRTEIGSNEYLAELNHPDFQGYEMADVHRRTIGACMFSTLYYSFAGDPLPEVKVAALTPRTTPYRDDQKHCIRIDDGTYTDYWFVQRDQLAPVEQAIECGSDKLHTDAAVLFVSTRDGAVVSTFRIGGTQASLNDQPLDSPAYELTCHL